jgi:hypothetical protein
MVVAFAQVEDESASEYRCPIVGVVRWDLPPCWLVVDNPNRSDKWIIVFRRLDSQDMSATPLT